MVSRTYWRIELTTDSQGFSKRLHKQVHERIDDIVDHPGLSLGGCRLRDDEIETEVMTLYKGMAKNHRTGVDRFSSEEQVRYLAHEIQLLTRCTGLADDFHIFYANLTPPEGQDEELNLRMRDLSYKGFEVDGNLS